ncbi:hypothetical protein DMH88_12095 [Escherichia coli]|nr:hypothetical protein [Escherichia coli]
MIYRPLGQEAMRTIVEMKLAQVVRRLFTSTTDWKRKSTTACMTSYRRLPAAGYRGAISTAS